MKKKKNALVLGDMIKKKLLALLCKMGIHTRKKCYVNREVNWVYIAVPIIKCCVCNKILK